MRLNIYRNVNTYAAVGAEFWLRVLTCEGGSNPRFVLRGSHMCGRSVSEWWLGA